MRTDSSNLFAAHDKAAANIIPRFAGSILSPHSVSMIYDMCIIRALISPISSFSSSNSNVLKRVCSGKFAPLRIQTSKYFLAELKMLGAPGALIVYACMYAPQRVIFILLINKPCSYA